MEERRTAGGVGFFGLLTLLFIGLKLGGAIDWSWWWIFSPIWLPSAIIFVLFVLFIALDIIFGNDKGGFDGRG